MISDIVRPSSVAEAVRAGTAAGAAYLGGGTWLNSGRASGVAILVSLEKLGLDSISAEPGSCRIGASVTFQSIVDNAQVPSALREAAKLTASRTLRNMVTVGGELGLCPEDSALIPALIVLGAEVSLAGKKKLVPIDAFLEKFKGDDGRAGLILGVSVPTGSAAAVRAVSRTSHSPRSLVAAVSARAAAPAVDRPMIVVSDCRGQVVRLSAAEQKLHGSPLPPGQDIESLARAEFSPRADIHGSAPYKRYMAGVLVADMLASLAGGDSG
jgi:putative selenate reductase FAD-binding subunit